MAQCFRVPLDLPHKAVHSGGCGRNDKSLRSISLAAVLFFNSTVYTLMDLQYNGCLGMPITGGRRLSLIELPAAGSQWHANNTNTLRGYHIDIGREFHGSDRWAEGLPADSRLGAKASHVCDLLQWVSPSRRNCSPGSYKGRISTYRSVNMQGDWKNKQGCSMTTCCWTVLLRAGRMTQSQWRTFL